jgi:hypothetical protein
VLKMITSFTKGVPTTEWRSGALPVLPRADHFYRAGMQVLRERVSGGLAPRVLEQLITEQGTKRPRSEQELATSTDLRPGEVRAVLNGLGDAALARRLDPSERVCSAAAQRARWSNPLLGSPPIEDPDL